MKKKLDSERWVSMALSQKIMASIWRLDESLQNNCDEETKSELQTALDIFKKYGQDIDQIKIAV